MIYAVWNKVISIITDIVSNCSIVCLSIIAPVHVLCPHLLVAGTQFCTIRSCSQHSPFKMLSVSAVGGHRGSQGCVTSLLPCQVQCPFLDLQHILCKFEWTTHIYVQTFVSNWHMPLDKFECLYTTWFVHFYKYLGPNKMMSLYVISGYNQCLILL